MMMYELLVTLVVSMVIHDVNSAGSIHTSVYRMERLVRKETEYITEVETILKNNLKTIQEIRGQLNSYKKLRPHIEDPTSYVANPVNCFLLIKQLTTYWNPMMTLLDESIQSLNQTRNGMENKWALPNDEDLDAAAKALFRIQATYHLSPTDMASGQINNKQHPTVLTAEDCRFMTQRSLHNYEDLKLTASWANEALRLHEKKNKGNKSVAIGEPYNGKRNEVWNENCTRVGNQCLTEESKALNEFKKHVIYLQMQSAEQLDFLGEALRLSEKLLQIPNTLLERESFQIKRDQFASEVGKKPYNIDGDINPWKITLPHHRRKYTENYERLCRGQGQMGAEISSQLHCRYVNHGNPFLRLAPFKEEEVYLDPRIVLYHDVIYDSEIDQMKQLAGSQKPWHRIIMATSQCEEVMKITSMGRFPQLATSQVYDIQTGKIKVSPDRVASSIKFKTNTSAVIDSLNNRGEFITGLRKEPAEPLSVLNYGIGGFFGVHYDNLRGTGIKTDKGDRIATMLHFLSDVEAGGATVFPHLKLSVFPRKGSALLWYNLHRDGRMDFRLLHAGCPVNIGSKWIGTRWYQERGQELRKPCLLKPDVGRSTKYSFLTMVYEDIRKLFKLPVNQAKILLKIK